MLCHLCANIDLDQLASEDGYKHHSNCTNLLQSIKNGCESCELIWESQTTSVGSDLALGHDIGDLDTQITARAVNQEPGDYTCIRYGQEAHYDHWYEPEWCEARPGEGKFLWSFLAVAARNDDPTAILLKWRVLDQGTVGTCSLFAFPWLNDCLRTHAACRMHSPGKVLSPTRVIDVGPSDGSQDPFLHVSEGDVDEWVTLSHCWGKAQPLKTTLETLASHRAVLPIESLPNLFQDAVLITREMGYRYLWIDSLCIIQDSLQDWARETSRMGNVYKHCVFTIAAETCGDSRERILRSRNHMPYVQQGCHSLQKGLRGAMLAYSLDAWHASNDDPGFLRSRAWVLQEEILSPRTLRWTAKQLVWDCRTMTRSEEQPLGDNPLTEYVGKSPSRLKLITLSPEHLDIAKQKIIDDCYPAMNCDPLSLWYYTVTDFCERTITYRTDILPALAGVAKEIAAHTGYDYRAGIWAQDAHTGLLWSTWGQGSYPTAYLGPSWSWIVMSMTTHVNAAGVTRRGGDNYTIKAIAEVVSIDITYSGEDEFGQVTSGKLRLEAPCKKASSCKAGTITSPMNERLRPYWDNYDPRGYAISPGTICCWFDGCKLDDFDTAALGFSQRGGVFAQVGFMDALRVSTDDTDSRALESIEESFRDSMYALILEPTASGNENEYYRRGVARVSDDLAEGWGIHTVNII